MDTVDPVLALLMRLWLAGILFEAAWHKLRDRRGFRVTLDAYRVLPRWLVAPLVIAFPVLELFVAFLLLPIPQLASLAQPAAAAAALIFVAYGLAMAINLRRGRRRLDCGCGVAGTRQEISPGLVVRNLALAGCAVFAVLPAGARTWTPVDMFTLAAGTAALLGLWRAGTILLAEAPRLRALAEESS